MPKHPAIQETLGAAIRAARRERGFSQEGFAARCGLHRTYIGGVERGERNVTVGTLATIAAGLDVPAWTLLKREPAGESDA
jgi:transcriptional regulator with XRE-family HTH domain